ncbi:MAG: cytochrome c3 family protein [Proteobacteria bacterium]|nr:cytochrome c3 family protein [Pseudomonadota bacterium]MBU1715598.1 cytochrome c3 family protein [Pseudomonadota bacterium]
MNRRDKSVIKLLSLLVIASVLLIFGGQAMGEDEEDGGTIVFTKPVMSVVFEHKIHISQGLECDSCHDDIFVMETGVAESKDDFTMESLYQGKYCGACHDGETAFASNTRCTTCHIGVKGFNKMQGGGKSESAGHH